MKHCINGTINVKTFFDPEKKVRRVVAIDEIKIKKTGVEISLINLENSQRIVGKTCNFFACSLIYLLLMVLTNLFL